MSDGFEHVVVLMLENHSFDQMLGSMTEVYPELDGVRPGDARANRDDAGREYAQHARLSLQVKPDPKHEHPNVLRQLEDGNGGFVKDYLRTYGEKARAGCEDVMGYFPRGSLPALHTLAEQFVVCDHWFSSLPGPTWPNRFFALSGTSNGRVLMPEGVRQLSMLWNQTQDTLFDRLNAKRIPWRVYFYDFPVSLLLRHQRRPENLLGYRRMHAFFEDARGPASAFPSFALIEPKYFGVDQNDDHPPHNVMKAQKLIADVYNAIRSNHALWASTLLIVVWDEHGGFYDHVVPPAAQPPDDLADEFSFDRLGVRVPAVLVSPYLARGVVSAQLEHSSVLQYAIGKWALEPLGRRTRGGDPLGAALPRVAQERQDTIPFIRVPNSDLVPRSPLFADWERHDESQHHDALHLAADVLEAADEGIEGAVSAAARLAAEYQSALPRIRAAMGDKLIAMGRALQRPLDEAQAARVRRTSDSVAKVIGDASRPSQEHTRRA
jgi:phospholipase C